VPPFAIVKFTPAASSILTPGSILSVAPLLTVKFAVTTYGLFAPVQVVNPVIAPLTFAACNGVESRVVKIRIKRAEKGEFFLILNFIALPQM
jgi:hypothetical protein